MVEFLGVAGIFGVGGIVAVRDCLQGDHPLHGVVLVVVPFLPEPGLHHVV